MEPRRAVFVASMFVSLLAHAPFAAVLQAESISVDFGRQSATSSHLIFGGCSPNPAHVKAWDLLAKAGITSLRFDVKFGVYPDPKNITLDDYRSSLGKPGTVADINSRHWNWSRMDGDIDLCQKHGLKSVAIICYTPKWLGFIRDMHSVPKDMEIWQDLVRQVMRRYQDKIDYWEIWNEPNGPNFLITEGSPYPQTKDGMLAAYADISKHTIAAVNQSGVKARLGGPVLATWGAGPFMDKFLGHDELTRNLSFLSYHIYFHTPQPNRVFPPQIAEFQRNHRISLPLFITEWNCHSGVAEKHHPLKNTPESVGWVGKTFALFLQWGIVGANYYNMTEGKQIDDGLAGAYKIVDGQAKPFRFVKVFHLLSKVLGLGSPQGTIKVFSTRVAGLADEQMLEPLFADSLYAVGCANASGTPVVIVANPSANERSANLRMSGLSGKAYRARAFVVRTDHSPEEATIETPLFDRELDISPSGAGLTFPIAAHNVVGIRLEARGAYPKP